jgi:uncharacterized surface protein with fasciclin (FAS1) repeats
MMNVAMAAGAAPVQVQKNIVETAVSAGSFSTLVKAVQAAGLQDALSGRGPFTVFAPTDDAFKKLPAGTLDAVLKDKQKLTDILKYHVASGRMMSGDVLKSGSIKTLQGGDLKVNPGPAVNDAKIIKADIECSNGVIHVIDSVLLPR